MNLLIKLALFVIICVILKLIFNIQCINHESFLRNLSGLKSNSRGHSVDKISTLYSRGTLLICY